MSLALSLKNVSKTYGDDTLFENLTMDFLLGEQLGLIGMNGTGKSTLLRIIAGKTLPDEGEKILKSGLKLYYLAQEETFNPDLTIEQVLYDSFKDSHLEEKQIHAIVNQALGKGKFDKPDTRCKQLSGGWKKRLAITKALCAQPDILLLDEPTNHLDIDGILWLESILKTASFSFILVSHDRAFLENVCKTVVEIGPYYVNIPASAVVKAIHRSRPTAASRVPMPPKI